jgi:pantetheine-phosphate adenylyltransferase
MAKFTRAIYPGSFDPPTNGHLDLIDRGVKVFDELIIGVLNHPEKAPLFSVEERIDMLRGATASLPNVRVEAFDGLLVHYAAQKGALVILRGIRAISDYEYELQMALMNRKLSPELETVFMTAAESYSYVSSRLVKEIYLLGGSIQDLVPPVVQARLKAKIPVDEV